MSVWAQSWAYEQRAGSGGAKAVLVALAVFADEDGYCYPSQERIAGMTEQGVRTVRLHLAALEQSGLIARERRRRPDGTWTSDGFHLKAPADRLRPHIPAPDEPLRQILPPADIAEGKKQQNQRQISAQPAARNSTNQRQILPGNSQVEPSEEPLGEKSGLARGRASPARRATPIPDPFEVTQPMVDWAESEGIPFDLMQRESKKFVNYYTANGKTMKVWRKAWENWLLRALENVGKRNWA